MVHTFRGGIHPDDKKQATAAKRIEIMPPREKVAIPVSQNIGAMGEPVVSVGERVLMGQLIAKSDKPVSAPVHASVSGTVTAIEPLPHPAGAQVLSIVIENDMLDELSPEVKPYEKDFDKLESEDIMAIARNAGIVGMGGAGFPLSVKLESALKKTVDTIIVNGCECEPYITADNRLMIERPEHIVNGLKMVMMCLDVHKVYVAIEDNKPEAIANMRDALAKGEGNEEIHIIRLRTKYPQGGEKQLVKAVLGKSVPSGKLPLDVGAFVANTASLSALYTAYSTGMPLIERVLTVSGSVVSTPKNLLVRIGTRIGDVIDECGGFVKDPNKVVLGGPMMGTAQYTLDVPVIKATNAILCFGEEEEKTLAEPCCIHCGKCVGACPMKLMPIYIAFHARKDEFDECKRLGAMDCMECGCCSYICPGRLHLTQEITMAKLNIISSGKRP